MTDVAGQRPEPPSSEQFTVPIPSGAAPQSKWEARDRAPAFAPPPPLASSAPAATLAPGWHETQVLPVAEPSDRLPPWHEEPVSVANPAREAGHPRNAAGPSDPLTDPLPDPLLAQIGTVLFWITVGWWATVLVRLLGSLVREGPVSTLFIESLGRWPEEPIVAAVVSVLAALVLLLGRGSRGRDALGWASGVLAVVTVGVAIWRLLP